MSMCRGRDLLLTIFVTGLLAAPATADLVVTARETHLSVDYVFGSVDGSIAGNESLTERSLDANLVRSIRGGDSGSGSSGDVSWIATYSYDLTQEFVPQIGDGFGGASSATLFAFAADAGIASVAARPGSRLVVDFVNTTTTEVEIHSILTSGCTFSIDRVAAGVVVENVFSHAGSAASERREELLLMAGDYVVIAESQSDALNGSSGGDSWSFELTSVPEPGAGMLLAAGIAGVAGCARQRRPQIP